MTPHQTVQPQVDEHGRITRREAAELCRITGPQAYRLLDRLANEGLLMREGKRGRGVGYAQGGKRALEMHGLERKMHACVYLRAACISPAGRRGGRSQGAGSTRQRPGPARSLAFERDRFHDQRSVEHTGVSAL